MFQANELDFADSIPVIMTEKDAVKCLDLDLPHSDFWYLEVTAKLPSALVTSILDKAGLNATKLHIVVST